MQTWANKLNFSNLVTASHFGWCVPEGVQPGLSFISIVPLRVSPGKFVYGDKYCEFRDKNKCHSGDNILQWCIIVSAMGQ